MPASTRPEILVRRIRRHQEKPRRVISTCPAIRGVPCIAGIARDRCCRSGPGPSTRLGIARSPASARDEDSWTDRHQQEVRGGSFPDAIRSGALLKTRESTFPETHVPGSTPCLQCGFPFANGRSGSEPLRTELPTKRKSKYDHRRPDSICWRDSPSPSRSNARCS